MWIPSSRGLDSSNPPAKTSAISRRSRTSIERTFCRFLTVTDLLLTLRLRFATVLLVSRYDPLDKRMPYDVTPGKLDNPDAVNLLEHPMRLEQARMFMRRQIDLGFVPGNDGLRV